MEERILIVEDNAELAELVSMHLRDQGYRPEVAGDGTRGLALAQQGDWALIVLDLMLPGLDGLEICRRLRAEHHRVPILMLSAKAEEVDKVLGLEFGADDYLTKPFSVRELIARVKAILRRVQVGNMPPEAPAELIRGGLRIHLENRSVSLDGTPLELTRKEFDLLTLFATNPGRAYRREQLLNQVWGYSFSGYEHTVNSHINRLRSKIEADPSNPSYILTVWGFGYRFVGPEEPVA